MPINVFSNSSSSYDNGNEIDTNIFVQKPYLRTNSIESKIEEDIDLKNKYRIKKLSDTIGNKEACSKNYVVNTFNDPSIIKNTTHVDFNDKNLDNVHSIKVNSLPTLQEHLTPKNYVDNAMSYNVDESAFLRLDPDEKLEPEERGSIILNSTLTLPRTIIEIPAKFFVDYLFDEPSIIKTPLMLTSMIRISITLDSLK